MEAVQFRKLNKVGANSRPNGFVMLFGKTTEPVMREIIDMEPIPADWTYSTYCKQFLDESIYIPIQYRNAGYKTFGAQDYEASLLNFPNCLGLKKQEFQHTYRPFDLLVSMDRKLKIAHENASCSKSHNNMLKYLETFFNSYKDSSKFSLSWVTKLAHDDSGRLYKADFDLYNFFLRNRHEETKTPFGRNEANNPFLYVIVPKSLRNSVVFKVLKAKQQELITPHDIHATLKDILEEQPFSNFIDTTFKSFLPSSRGSSLLREFEPGVQRNCKTLPIPFQYCICQYAKIPLDDDGLAIKLGQFAVDGINAIIKKNNESENCSHLILHQDFVISVKTN
uniref:RES domain-containing protein n=1 Tax=Angiostrongylus cantonensis TaxID=6313 RepID=A0A0K0D164_ANGCA